MKFMMTYAFTPQPGTRDETIARFRATGGPAPEGATLIGRWTRADFSGGSVLLETDDPQALTEFSLRWSDVLSLEVVPVLDDAQLAEVLERRAK